MSIEGTLHQKFGAKRRTATAITSSPTPPHSAAPVESFSRVRLEWIIHTARGKRRKRIGLPPEYHVQRPEVKFRFVFFPLQMLRISALCGPNEQKFGELLTWPRVISSSNLLPNLSTESWETQHLKARKHKPKFEFRTLTMCTTRGRQKHLYRARISHLSVGQLSRHCSRFILRRV